MDYKSLLEKNRTKEIWIRQYKILNKEEDINSLIIWPDLPYWLYVNDQVLNLIQNINGLTYDSIILNYKNSEVSLEEDIKEILILLLEAGAASFENKFESEHPRTEYVLQYLTLNITNNCNLYCKHCYIDASEEKKKFMSLSEAKLIIDKLNTIMIPSCNIIISGGEALLNKDCINILKYFNYIKKGKLTLVTNGTLITPELSKALKEVDNLSIQVSLDGASKAVHEKIRGSNTFERTINGIKTLSEDNHTIYLSPIVTEELYEELDAYFSLAAKLKVKAVFLQPVNCVGRAKSNKINRVDDSLVFKKVVEVYEKFPDLINMVRGTLEIKYLTSIKLLDRCFYCGTGSSTLCIQPNGDIFPCPNTIIDELKIGNMFIDDIQKKWTDSQILNKLRNININVNLNEKCRNCEVKYFCGGGCRGAAIQNTGDLYSLSDSCEYEKKQRIEMLWYVAQKPEMFQTEVDYSIKNVILKEEETRALSDKLYGSVNCDL